VIVLAAAVLAAGMVTAALLLTWAARDRLLRERLCDKVVITLKTGPSFSGVLFKVDDRAVILRDTQALGAAHNGDHLVVDGELVLFRTDIEYLQRP
jgi:hypothetical protein